MSILEMAKQRERVAAERPDRASKRAEQDATRPLAGAALAAECGKAARYVGRRAGISADECEALAQMIAEKVLRGSERRATYRPRPRAGEGQRKRPPLSGTDAAPNVRALLRFLDRAERMPTVCEREIARIDRGQTGRDHLRQLAAMYLRDSREWRDLAESHRARVRREGQERGPAVVTSHDPLAPGFLALAERREQERSGEDWVAPIRADHAELAAELAERIAQERELPALAPAETRRVRAALLLDLCGAPLAATGAALGWSVRSTATQASAGRAILRDRIAPAELAALLRSTARDLGLAERVALDRPDLSPAERAARDRVERVRRYAGRWQGPAPSVAPDWSAPTRARSVLRWVDLLSERVRYAALPAERERRACGGHRVAPHAPDLTEQRRKREQERARRERVAALARRTYYRDHPTDWTVAGAEQAAGEALAAL